MVRAHLDVGPSDSRLLPLHGSVDRAVRPIRSPGDSRQSIALPRRETEKSARNLDRGHRIGRPRPKESPSSIATQRVRQAPAEDLVGVARQLDLFRRYGNFTMAYATLQPGMKYFHAHGGYIAYDQSWGVTFVLGDPVAPTENHPAILEDFVRAHPRSCFCQISERTGAILEQLGWFVNEFGADMELELPEYDFSGSGKSKFRQAARKIEREGYTIEEATVAKADAAELDALSSAWLATRTVRREARFLVRPFAFGDEPDIRRFYLRAPDSSLVALVGFDPICEEGRVIGYSPAIKRRTTAAPTGAEEALCKFAIERFRAEGLRTFRLGLLPLYDVQDSAFREAWRLKKLFQWAFRYGDRWLYSFRGHADFKHRYRGNLNKVYFATHTRWNLWNLIALLRLCRLR